MRRVLPWLALALLAACAPALPGTAVPAGAARAPAAPPPLPSPPPAPAQLATAPASAGAAPAPAAAASPDSDPPSRLRKWTAWRADRSMAPDERARGAEAGKRAVVEKLFADAGVAFPPGQLLFRAFKRDMELEVWAATAPESTGAPLSRVTTYGICRLSGDLGPKRKEGDAQVPEGFYKLHYLWPNSAFHLEMKVGYPNDLDRHLSDHVPEGPGGNIMIHGSCASVGCLAMSDERIEELWAMASAFQQGEQRVHVHIFPGRDMAALLRDREYAQHWPFWRNLEEGYGRFERTHRLFHVEADWHAKYLFR